MLSSIIKGGKDALKPRRYQETIFAKAAQANTLVVLPTGLGKTMIAVMLAIHRLSERKDSKILVLAPTKPLVQQHFTTFKKHIDIPDEEFVFFTGAIGPQKRKEQWKNARIVFATPQVIENDVLGGLCSLKDVSLLVVDEAHRAVGDYSYVYLAKKYLDSASSPRILALTASPGTDQESITEVCAHLGIEEIEVRNESDPDVKPYVQDIDIKWVEVDLPEEFKEAQKILRLCYTQRIEYLHQLGAINIPISQINKRTLLAMQAESQGKLARGERDMEMMKSISVIAEALKIYHAVDLLETQGLGALERYFDSLAEAARNGQSKAVQNIMMDPLWKAAVSKVNSLVKRNIEHPKLGELKRIIREEIASQDDMKIIVFNQFRDQAVKIKEAIGSLGISSEIFVGQAKKGDTGMSQKEQHKMLQEFSDGKFRCLIATSVAEEGLDIPKVDLVIFYEPIPSAIRTVQRRGRTGRNEKGKVMILLTKGTADATYKWVAHHKEKRMYRSIEEVKKTFSANANKISENESGLSKNGFSNENNSGTKTNIRKDNDSGSKNINPNQKTLLQQYFDEKKSKQEDAVLNLKIIVDHREKASPVMKAIVDSGVQLELKQLSIGDYQVSDRVVIEYKQVGDFVDSMVDGRLLQQLKNLKQYTRPVILVEGEADIYSLRRVHPNAIAGMLATIAVSFNIPILWSKSPKESASLIIALAKREQIGGSDFQFHSAKPLTDDELMEYIVAAFPGIGSTLAKPLLSEFGSIKNIVNASEDDLKKVQLIGEKKAKRIREIADREYKSEKKD